MKRTKLKRPYSLTNGNYHPSLIAMSVRIILIVSALMAISIEEIYGHGMLMEPINRSSAWRKGFHVPPNYDDDGNYCGGLNVSHLNVSYFEIYFIVALKFFSSIVISIEKILQVQIQNGGKCGLCGDNYVLPQPRPNENTGYYGRGIIVRR